MPSTEQSAGRALARQRAWATGLVALCAIVFVCGGGRRASRAAYAFAQQGYTRSSALKGGMVAWEAAGLLEAVEQAQVQATIEKVQDIQEIMKYRVMMVPAVAIDGQVKISGKVPTIAEVKALLTPAS